MSQLRKYLRKVMPATDRLRISRSGTIAAFGVALSFVWLASTNDDRTGATVPQDKVPVQGTAIANDLETLLVALETNDQEVSASAHAMLRKHHEQLIQRLRTIAKVPQKEEVWGSPKGRAIELLALFGAREAAPFLVENIEYREQGLSTEASQLAGRPCGKALRTLGATCTPDILRHLRILRAEDVSNKAIELYATVLEYVYHNEGGTAEAIAVVERARDRTRADQRANLDRLLDSLSGHGKPASPYAAPQ